MISIFDQSLMGGLFGDPELRDILSEEKTLSRYIEIEVAYTKALGQSDAVNPDIATRAATAIESAQIFTDALHRASGVDGIIIPDLIRQIKERADPELHAAIHTGLTSQDVMDTALVLALREANSLLSQRIEAVGQSLGALHAQFGTHTMMGVTRMQDALPITVGDRIDAWGMPFDDHQTRLTELTPRLIRLQIGGPVGLRDLPDGVAQALAATLDLPLPPKAWHSMRDGLAEYASWLSLVSGTLGKMGQDIAMMALQGREISLSGGGTSSAMAHKKNPVKAELLVTLATFNATQLAGMHTALRAELERSGAMWALEWMLLPQMIAATGLGLNTALSLLKDIKDLGAPA
ncbi:3-carboxy-cis,cis-muconate cycloisomerase [Litoreibacter ponti]|uniref:3-carboxy-cis,cis-muconate cycloisomerase n=1 Tax=Litoreibacter ponti TaxID=1510457 RepID=A0A2T6BPB9_9RHOB|nr:3-carboxy-cis,cis-muconate cycloisomerase [Litoreibacter ponti]PTX57915.1 3-carboxy-cis,cis-muconate cycloisomerase [Litoreibacter ponti]